MIPSWWAAASGFTSGTTRGTSGRIRKALELSIVTAPVATIVSIQALEVLPPAEASTISTPLNASAVVASTVKVSPPKVQVWPADRAEASNFSSAIGNCRSSSNCSSSVPTAPVAPKMATRYPAKVFSPQERQKLANSIAHAEGRISARIVYCGSSGVACPSTSHLASARCRSTMPAPHVARL